MAHLRHSEANIIPEYCDELVGGITEIEPDNLKDYSDLIEGLKLAEQRYNDENSWLGLTFAFFPGEIQASVQVVQGSLYRVKAEIGPEYCVAAGGSDVTVSQRGICDGNTHSCTFKLWSRTWLPPSQRLLIKDWTCPEQ